MPSSVPAGLAMPGGICGDAILDDGVETTSRPLLYTFSCCLRRLLVDLVGGICSIYAKLCICRYTCRSALQTCTWSIEDDLPTVFVLKEMLKSSHRFDKKQYCQFCY